MANVILGRPDNSIKNYWNCSFKYKQMEMSLKLEAYFHYCVEYDSPTNITVAKNQINQRLMKYFV